MELTGKCKEEFEKYRYLYYRETENEASHSGTTIWDYVGESMQYGVLEDYFDSVGIRISINQYNSTYWYDIQSPFFDCDELKTRPEARTAAIEKANELRNETLNK